ncbi:hypothetical protein AVEN_108868-1, partial [Araneus ventricosus]
MCCAYEEGSHTKAKATNRSVWGGDEDLESTEISDTRLESVFERIQKKNLIKMDTGIGWMQWEEGKAIHHRTA